MKSKYNFDKKLEELFGKWLDTHFYNKKNEYTNIIRIKDRKIQKIGVDVIVDIIDDGSHKQYYIDEKTALHYLTKDIDTFAFEILNRGSGAKGWLFNSTCATNCYLLAWPRSNTNNPLTEEDIEKAELMLIDKIKIINYLDSIGVTSENIVELVNKNEDIKASKSYKVKINEFVSLHYNETLKERPVNLLIMKEKLSELSFYHKVKK